MRQMMLLRSRYSHIMLTILLLVCLTQTISKEFTIANKEAELFKKLFNTERYHTRIRPIADSNQTICVEIDLKINQLQQIVEKDQVMHIQVNLGMKWNDINLKWDLNKYDGIEQIPVQAEWIWLPDITLYNNADGNYQITDMTKAWVRHNGDVSWNPPAIYKSSCRIDVTYFPFDQQICDLKFGPWTHHTALMDLTAKPSADITNFKRNGEWDLIETIAQKHIIIYQDCCGSVAYGDITYYIILQRKPLFFTMNIIVPCVVINFLTILAFYVPNDEGEKITLCICVLLALTLFLLLIADIMPATSLVVPLIGKYILLTLFLVTFSIIITVFILNVHNRGPNTNHMPEVVKKIFIETLPKYLLMQRPISETDEGNQWEKVPVEGDFNRVHPRNLNPLIHIEEFRQGSIIENKKEAQIQRLVDGVIYIAQHLKNADDLGSAKDDWKFIALVIDRIFLIAYITMCISGTLIIIFNSPALYDPHSEKLVAEHRKAYMNTGSSVADNSKCPGITFSLINGMLIGKVKRPDYWKGP